ncbi:MAG: helix-hairpin-helix domain-containing protein, partial [Deltaproteobacteria bacterium]
MHITEKQLEGAVILVVFTLIAYFSVYLFSSYQNHPHAILIHGDKKAGPVIVEIAGDTRFNGIYFLQEKSSVSDALKTAGIVDAGILDREILDTELSTGKSIEIKPGGRPDITEMSGATKLMLDIPIDLNQASSRDLILVPGIGEKTAAQIISFRRT